MKQDAKLVAVVSLAHMLINLEEEFLGAEITPEVLDKLGSTFRERRAMILSEIATLDTPPALSFIKDPTRAGTVTAVATNETGSWLLVLSETLKELHRVVGLRKS